MLGGRARKSHETQVSLPARPVGYAGQRLRAVACGFAPCLVRRLPAVSRNALPAAAILLVAAACASNGIVHRPFTKDWTYHQERRSEMERREQRQADELVLIGEKEGARAAVELDEKGKPKLNVGRKRGFSADIDVDTDEADVMFKYEWEWGRKEKAQELAGAETQDPPPE